ncbi:MAG: protein kinase domain-containing protein [Limisphaerales bacterium]
MNPGVLAGILGGVIGGIIGILGGVVGTYFALKSAKSPRERAFVIRASIICWAFVLAFVLGMWLIPGFYKILLIPIYFVGLVSGILIWIKKLTQIHLEESKSVPPVAPTTQIFSRKCPQCGVELKPDASEGLCPACLLQRGVPTEPVAEQNQKPFAPPTVTELAALFPQLEILELIGKGGMGAVYKARQKQLERIVALKILPPNIGNDPAFAERFAREAKALAKLNHPGIVTLYEFGETSGQFYFLMEFVDGVNLRQLLQNGRVSPREALAIVPQICDALQFAHDQGIVHRDIKPENILLDRRGRVKVADFGLAKIVVGQASRLSDAANELSESKDRQDACPTILTDAGKIMGTPNYMSPEQKENPGEVDHRADIYALGVVFYQMLTGELPGKKIEPPSRKVQIDVRLDEIVLRALEKKPELRYSQASVLKTEVEAISVISSDKNEREQKSRAKLWFISPLSSPEVRDIATHFTKSERSEFSFYGLLWGVWVCLATFGNFFLIKFYPSPGNWILPALIISIFIASLSPMLRMQKRFLCSTAWAKKQNYSADQIKLFSFSWLNFWRLLIFAVIVALLIFAQNKMFLHLSGVPELTASLKETETRTKELSAELAGQSKNFYIGQTYFPFGDSIEITSVQRSKNQMTVRGFYNLVSHDQAEIALYITTTNNADNADTNVPESLNQVKPAFKGRRAFLLMRSHLVPGLPHVSMYADGHPFASVYFGNKQQAAKERQADWITNSLSASAETWSPTLAPGEKPDLQKILQDADDLMNQGRYEESLQRRIWYYNHALEFGDSYQHAVRMSSSFIGWVELARRYPKAKQALFEIRDRDTQKFSNSEGYFDLFMELYNINHQLQDDDATIAVFKSIQQDKQLARQCFGMAEGLLVQHGDYELCMSYIGDPQAAFEGIRQNWVRMKQMEDQQAAMRQQQAERFQAMAKTNALFANLPTPLGPPKMADNNFVGQTCQLIEILVGVGRKEDAEKIQDEAVTVLDDSRLKSAVSDAEENVNQHKAISGTITITNSFRGTIQIFPKTVTNATAINPATGLPLTPGSVATAINPATGLPMSPGETETIDPATGLPTTPGNTTAINPATGLPMSPGQTEEIDPNIGLPVTSIAKSDESQILAAQPPVVVETSPISGARDVEPGETEIRVRFSKEMADDSWSWSTAWENSTPEFIGQPHYNSDSRTCIAKVKLEPDKTYAFWLNSEKFQNFKDADGRPAIPYLLIFQTKSDINAAAISAAQKWLALIDAGNYSESWKQASAIFQGGVTESAWENSMNTFRKPLGGLVSRKLSSAQRMTELPGAPDGQYVVMQFETSFANKKSAIETVTFDLEKDGEWKSSGYFIK